MSSPMSCPCNLNVCLPFPRDSSIIHPVYPTAQRRAAIGIHAIFTWHKGECQIRKIYDEVEALPNITIQSKIKKSSENAHDKNNISQHTIHITN